MLKTGILHPQLARVLAELRHKDTLVIGDAGLRGFRVGDAQVSEKHCGFVINTGNATAKDVTTLMSDVQRIVMEKFGVKLEPEVKFLGEF
mgnify:CR=1 FL=1